VERPSRLCSGAGSGAASVAGPAAGWSSDTLSSLVGRPAGTGARSLV